MKGARELRSKYLYIAVIILTIIFLGCSPFKHIPENAYLLDNVKVEVSEKSAVKDDVYQSVTQKPNKKFLGIKFHMMLYSLSKPEKDKGLSRYFKKIGEEPVVWDSYQTKRSAENIKSYLKQNGYFNSKVNDSVFYNNKRKKVDIVYFINPKTPYTVNKLRYEIMDKTVEAIVVEDSLNALIVPGKQYRVDDLIEEKKRVQELLLNEGLYSFNQEDILNYISYRVDTSLKKKVDITMYIKNPDNEEVGYDKHYIYKLNNVYVFRNYNPLEYLNSPDYLNKGVDTLLYEGLCFLNKKGVKTKPGILSQSIYLYPGFNYSLENETLTMMHLRSLKVYQNVEINFREIKDSVPNNYERLMDCHINLTPMLRQFYQFDISLTNATYTSTEDSSLLGNIGAEASLKYQYKNLFGNAEILDFTIRGGAESLFREINTSNSNTVNIGAEVRLQIPKFLLPIKADRFTKKFSPKTSVSLAYRYYDWPNVYVQDLVNFSFGYLWRGNENTTHTLDPFRLNYVSIDKLDNFENKIGVDRFDSFRNKFISSTEYTFEFNNKTTKRGNDYFFFRLATEVGGNILNWYKSATDGSQLTSGEGQVNTIFGVPYAQFVRGNFDVRYYNVLHQNNLLVYRLFAGAAVPYGNSASVPFEKRYTIGGPNSLRAWSQNNLGPGTNYVDSARYRINGSSDVKLEFNLEYRYDIIWKLKGALFVDGGNIWSLSEEDENNRPEGMFEWNKFYKQIALGAGLGLRLDLDYFVIRLDWGLKVHNPGGFLVQEANTELGQKTKYVNWVFDKDRITKSDGAFQLGVTYPF